MSNMKEMIEFPTLHTFKVVGMNTEVFPHSVKGIFAEEKIQSVREQESGAGKYRSVSIIVHIETYEELESAYQSIQNLDGVKFYL